MCIAAAENSQLITLEYLHANNIQFDCDMLKAAAKSNNMAIFQWVHTHIARTLTNEFLRDLQEGLCQIAACAGNLQMLTYIRENIKEWDFGVYLGAASGGQLGILKYAFEHNCPTKHAYLRLDKTVYKEAASGGHVHVLEWFSNVTPVHRFGSDIMRIGVMSGHLRVKHMRMQHDYYHHFAHAHFLTHTHTHVNTCTQGNAHKHMDTRTWTQAHAHKHTCTKIHSCKITRSSTYTRLYVYIHTVHSNEKAHALALAAALIIT